MAISDGTDEEGESLDSVPDCAAASVAFPLFQADAVFFSERVIIPGWAPVELRGIRGRLKCAGRGEGGVYT